MHYIKSTVKVLIWKENILLNNNKIPAVAEIFIQDKALVAECNQD